MKKLIGILLFFFLFNPLFGALFYVDNTASGGNDGSSWTDAWESLGDIVWGGAGLDDGDTLYICGGAVSKTYRETLAPNSSGSNGSLITITHGAKSPSPSGHDGTVYINGADLVTTWADEGGDIWSATCTTEPKKVFFDGTVGVIDGTPDAEFDWYWDTNELFVWCDNVAGPDTEYTNPGVEATKRTNCIKPLTSAGRDYVRYEYLTTRYALQHDIIMNGSYNELDNLIIEHASVIGVMFSNSNYTTVTNCTARYNGVSGSNSGSGFEPTGGADYTSFTDCVGHNNAEDAFVTATDGSGTDNTTITDCTAYDNEEDGIDLKEGEATVENCSIYGNTLYGIIIHHGAINTIVRYCDITDNDGGGIALQGEGGDQIYYNYIEVPTDIMALRMYLDDDLTTVSFYNNVFYQTVAGSGQAVYIQRVGTLNWKNNIIYATGTLCMRVDATTATWNVDNNCYYRSDAGNLWTWTGSGNTDVLATWRTWSSGDANGIKADPLFVNAGTEDFHLQVGSPCKNTGTNVGLTRDYDGMTVPQGGGYDMGAYEYLEGAVLRIREILRIRNVLRIK